MPEIQPLVQRWRDGDQRAAEVIYNHFYGTVFGLAYTLLDQAADAEEVAQDALSYALTHIDRYDPQRARFTTWLYTITVSRCRNRRRRRSLPSLSLLAWLKRGGDFPDPTPDPESQAIQAAHRDEVWQAIKTLNPRLREAIVLRYWADYTYQEIGDMLGCSLRTAQSRVRLAHKQLEKILAQSDLRVQQEEGV